MNLDYYEEVIGEFKKVFQKNEFLILKLEINGKTHELKYPINSQESEIIQNEIKKISKGSKIGILRTDIPRKAIIMVKLGGENEKQI
ncbi:MAG: hypothetical protein ACLFVB_09620 [Thermoplasmata archaeon]